MLQKHGTLEAALEAGGFPTIADRLREYARITRLQADAPVPPFPDMQPDWQGAAALLDGWGHRALAKRIGDRAEP